jgi:antitoxin HicB
LIITHKAEDYKIEVSPLSQEDGGGFLAAFPELSGCMSDGETPEQALQNAKEAFLDWVAARQELNLPIPKPSVNVSGKFLLRMPKHLHKALLEQALHDGVSANTLLVSLLSRGIKQI